MIESPLLEDLARALVAERQDEARRYRRREGRAGPLVAPIARLLVRIGLTLDPAIGQELALQPAGSRPRSVPLLR
jgi:hypothetical protein